MASLATTSFTTAITGSNSNAVTGLADVGSLNLIAEFTATSGGTTCVARVQTSLDSGSTWYDIARFDFTTTSAVKYACCNGNTAVAPTSLSTLGTGDTKIDGLIGDRLRLSVTTTGTYGSGSKVVVNYQTHAG